MAPDLSDRDRERFRELRSTLEGVSRADPEPEALDTRPGPLNPMLATSLDGDLAGLPEDDWIAEQKYDGTRILLEKFDGDVSLYTRRDVERSETLAELTATATEVLPDGLVLDGEYTFLTPDGVSRFSPIHAADETVERENLSETFYVFDVLAQDGEWCTRDSLLERKDRLLDTVPNEGILSVVEYETADFQAYFDDLVELGEEGIIVKRRESAYHVGTRSEHWRKVKSFTETDVVVVGYTPGEGKRADTFGALVMTDGEQYVGRVGTGFDREELATLLEDMTPVDERPVPEEEVGNPYTPVEPFVVQVKYQEVTDSGKLRAPVFLRLRTDKPLDDVASIEAARSTVDSS